jgi:hypothetical protein
MIITSDTTPRRIQRFFPRKTLLMVQLRSPFTLTIAHDQGEAQAANNGQPDGAQLTQANTSPPFVFPWKGELWHIASVANSQWSLIIICEEEASVRQSDDVQQSSQSKLDYSIKQRC